MSDDKSEAPSPKRLRKAREDGNVPKSKDFSSSLSFLIGCAIIGATMDGAADQIKIFAKRCFMVGAEPSGRLLSLCFEVAQEGALLTLTLVAPLLGALFVISLGLGFGQTGGLFTLKALGFKFDKLNPVAGIKNTFFSGRAYVELLKSLIKLGVAGYLGYATVRDALREVVLTQRMDISQAIFLTRMLVGDLCRQVGGFMVLVGGFDYMYQRHTWYKGLMMSKQEQKDEHKESEGDPHAKHERKKMAKEIANAKGKEAVKQAKVVVTNPHEIAVALEYDPDHGMVAPQVLCRGERLVAQQIIAEAEKHGVPIMQNIALAHSLSELEPGDEVPEDLYEAVAEVLNWVYAMSMGQEPGAAQEGGDGGDW